MVDERLAEIEATRKDWWNSFENDLAQVQARRVKIMQHLQRKDLKDISRAQSVSWLQEHDKQWVDFLTSQRYQLERKPDFDKKVDRHNAAGRMVLRGGRDFLVGATITAITYLAAPGTGVFVVGWGGVLFGGLFFLIGFVRVLLAKRALRARPDPTYVRSRLNDLSEVIEVEEAAKGAISPRSR